MITLHDETTAPKNSQPTLSGIKNTNGFIPNLFRALANSPSSLNGFVALVGANDDGSLSPAERQIVQLAASIENESSYCVAGHSTFAESIGMPLETIAAIRNGEKLNDKRYQALVEFTRLLVRNRGQVSRRDRAEIEAVGFGAEQILEIIIGVALKTVTNFVSSAFELPLDGQFQPHTWASPKHIYADTCTVATA